MGNIIVALPVKGRAFTTQSLLRRGFQTCRSIPNAPIRKQEA